MSAVRNMTGVPWCVYIAQAYRAIWPWYILYALWSRIRMEEIELFEWRKSIRNAKLVSLTRWPSVFSCNGKHILHTSQWKKLFRPPIRQIPHPSQWYWFLSSSSNKLQTRHVYCECDKKNENIKFPEKWANKRWSLLTLPKRTPHFWQSACTFCRVSHLVQINSVNVFRSKWWSSFSSWQYRQL